MTKEKFAKILSGDVFLPSDLTPGEKKEVFAILQQNGMPQTTAYERLFNKGFDRWEIIGITHTVGEFLLTHNSDGEDTGYGYVQTLAKGFDRKTLLEFVYHMGLLTQFYEHMRGVGMLSISTIRKRFLSDNWKRWERRGVASIVSELCSPRETAKKKNQTTLSV